MEKVCQLFKKYKAIIAYLFFGGCTTILNWAVYYLFYNVLNVSNVLSTIIAWFLAVVFAYVTNKKWVFDSKANDTKTIFSELIKFFLARIVTGVLDVAVMWIAVDLCEWNSNIWKLLSNIIVIVANYVFSKFLVFKKNRNKDN